MIRITYIWIYFGPRRPRWSAKVSEVVTLIGIFMCIEYFRRTPHPVIASVRDNEDDIRGPVYSYSIAITGWGVLLLNSLVDHPWWEDDSSRV